MLICSDDNLIPHKVTDETKEKRLAFTKDHLKCLWAYFDEQIALAYKNNSKSLKVLQRDKVLYLIIYYYGLRANEVSMLDTTDFLHNPKRPEWENFGGIIVRFGKASGGSPPKRRTVWTISETAYLTLLNHSELFKYIDNNPIEIYDLSIEHITEYTMKYRVSHYNTFENFLLKENVIHPISSEELLKKFLGKLANTLQAHFSIVLTSYSEYLLNKQKALRKHGHVESFKIETLINYCTIARNFLQVISHSIESIHEITDIDVDKYLQSNPSHNMVLRNFIKWLNNSISMFSKLRLPYCNSISNKISIIDNEDLFKVIESLSSPATPYKEKVIGFLLLFYAIRPSESREIKLEHYTKVNCIPSRGQRKNIKFPRSVMYKATDRFLCSEVEIIFL